MARLKQCPELTPKNGATASLDHRIATQNRFFEVSIRFELVGEHHARRPRRLLKKFAYEPPSCCPVSSVLNQNVENETVLVDERAMACASHRGS